MFPREFKNWKYKMQVGTTINLGAISGRQTVASICIVHKFKHAQVGGAGVSGWEND